MEIQDYASLKLREEVIDKGLCPLCGGCASGCPYLGQYKGKIVQLDCCTLVDGSCYRNCPRTATDLDALTTMFRTGEVEGTALRNGLRRFSTILAFFLVAMRRGRLGRPDSILISRMGTGMRTSGAATPTR